MPIRSAEQGDRSLAASDHITVGLYRRGEAYDPRMIQKFEGEHIRDADTLRKVASHADATGRTLSLTAANLLYARKSHPDLFELLDDERYFEPVTVLPAIEPYIAIGAWHYRGGSLPSNP